MTTHSVSKPWYREPWPWIIMSGPAIVVVAGIATIVIAVKTSDGVVADDYYKQGLGINRTIERDARAKALAIAAQVTFNEERDAVRVLLASNAALPGALRMTLVHARRDLDQSFLLHRVGPSLYESKLRAPGAGRWRIALEDDSGTWRISSGSDPLGEGRGGGLSITLGGVD